MSMMRTRWAAIGAAVAVTLGAGGVGLVSATKSSGERSVYTAIEPCRVLDTRPNQGVGGRTSPLGPGEVYEIDLLQNDDECDGIPTDLTGVGLNVTALFATELTDLRFWAEGNPPNAANLNPAPGQPPTPNAVTTEVAGDETFQVRNQAGSVHLIVDLVGLYQNHHHDDRYYRKDQTDSQIQATIDDQPWSVHIPPSEMHPSGSPWPNITFASGVSAIGMAFNDGVFGRVYYGFRLPDNYAAGTDVTVEMKYLAVSGFGAPVFPCDSVWWSNGPYVNRAGSAVEFASTSWETPRGIDASQTRLTSTQQLYDDNAISTATMTIDGTNLQPGDELNLTLNRDADETDDTCEGMMVTGLLVRSAG